MEVEIEQLTGGAGGSEVDVHHDSSTLVGALGEELANSAKAPLAPQPVPFSPPKAALERSHFLRLYQVFCNLTAHTYQV